MIYLSAGIIDTYDNPKVDLECAVTKAYSQDILRNLTKFAMDLIDTPVTIEGHPIELDIRNATQLQFYENSGALKSYAGRVGMQLAMVETFLSHFSLTIPPLFSKYLKLFQLFILRIISENVQIVTKTRFCQNSG